MQSKSKWLPQTTYMALHHSDTRFTEFLRPSLYLKRSPFQLEDRTLSTRSKSPQRPVQNGFFNSRRPFPRQDRYLPSLLCPSEAGVYFDPSRKLADDVRRVRAEEVLCRYC